MPDTAKLVQSTMALRESVPQQWDNWVASLREYTSATVHEMIRAEPERLQQAQGRAQALQDLVQLLLNAPTAFDKQRVAVKRGRIEDGRSTPWPG